jgi:phosphotriesterase-related protein
VIRTVLGDISPLDLGFCQSHEHIYLRPCPAQAGNPIASEEKSLAELWLYRNAGGRAIVDAQPPGAGRDAEALERLSRQSGVHIIASTGFHKLSYYPAEHWIVSSPEDELARFFTGELEEGMLSDGDTAFPRKRGRAKAGQIKTALDVEGLTLPYRKLFAAAAQAAKSTGRPLMVHIERGSDPLALADFLEKQGMEANHLIFCHTDRALPDLAVHKTLCRRGIYLEYDTIARPKYHDDDRELAIIAELLASGYEKQLLLGLDTTPARLQSYGGEPGLAYIREKFIKKLRDSGITEKRIRLFLEENPARVFG